MTTVRTYPYRRPGDRTLATPWLLEREGVRQPAPDALPHWDPATDLAFVRTVAIDLRGIRHDCGLDVGSDLRLAATWHSPGTSLRGRGFVQPLGAEDSQSVDVMLRVPGAELGVEVALVTSIILGRNASRASAVAPWRAGTTLWSDELHVRLEGAAPRFPVEILDFADFGWLPSEASWYLDWDPEDLETPLLGGPRLLLNARNPAMRRACAMGADDQAGAAILEGVRFEVVRSLLTGTLAVDGALAAQRAFEKGTTGHAIKRLLSLLFPDSPIELVRQRAARQPELFSADLQSRLRLFFPRRSP